MSARLLPLLLIGLLPLGFAACEQKATPDHSPETAQAQPAVSEKSSDGIKAKETSATAEPEPLSQLTYVIGEGESRKWLRSPGESPADAPVGVLAWADGLEGDDRLALSTSGGIKGLGLLPGGVSLLRGESMQLIMMQAMLLPTEPGPESKTTAPQPFKPAVDMPIRVRELGDAGGEVSLDLSGVDKDFSVWDRRVFWTDTGQVRIVDELAAHLGKRIRFQFFITLGSPGEFTVNETRQGTVIETADNTYFLQTDARVKLEVNASYPGPKMEGRTDEATEANNSGAYVVTYDPGKRDVRILIKCRFPVSSMKLVTRVEPNAVSR